MDKKKQKKDILVKIVCLICSFGLWLYITNVENEIITSKFTDIPIEIINSDVLSQYKLSMVPGQNLKITLSVEGATTDVYRAKSDQFKLVVDLSTYALKKGENSLPVEIKESPSNVNVIRPERLKVNIILDDLVEKSVPIKTEIDAKAKQGHYISEPILNQSEAIVSGPSQLVNRVNAVVARGEVKDLDSDTELELPLIAIDEAGRTIKDIETNPKKVNVVIPVRRNKLVSIKVNTKGNLPNSQTLKSIEVNPNKVEIIGDESVIKGIDKIETEEVDLSKIADNKELNVRLSIPENVSIINGVKSVNIKILTNEPPAPEKEVPSEGTKDIQSKVKIKGLKEGLNATLEADTVNVTIKGKNDILNSLKEEDILAEIDLTDAQEGELEITPKITVKQGLSIEKTTPEKIKVKITKK